MSTQRCTDSLPEGTRRVWILVGVGGTTFTIIFLQIILFRLLTIFGGYLTANSVISIALLGISVGGLIGWRTSHQAPLQTMIRASFLLPFAILLASVASISAFAVPLLASILLMPPFVCASAVITVALARSESHFVYFIDLLGAAIGALLVSLALRFFREESSLLFLSAFTCLILGCFLIASPTYRFRRRTFALMVAFFSGFLIIGGMNLQLDWLNFVRLKLLVRYPDVKVLFSRSSLVGRYDIVRRTPTSGSLKAYENGYTIDTIVRLPKAFYQIDPRVPHTLMKDPVILILGLSGDGVSKTATALGKKVYGVEINPAVVKLQTNELVEFNGNSYENIKVSVADARSYVQRRHQKCDIITLMNAHGARGATAGRAPSPEYLHTREAIGLYLERLTDRGVLIVEEPVSQPGREPPVWKLVMTMRQALIDYGSTQPERHFFIFQWTTKRNNYIQIVMSKTPLTNEEITKLRTWLQAVDDIRKIEVRVGAQMGPIRARTTILYSPDASFSTNYSRILRGEADKNFLDAYNLYVTTDDRPFHFDVDPMHRAMKSTYVRTLLMMGLLIPFLFIFLRRYRSDLRGGLPYVFVVALTGLGYLLIEVVLIQRYEIFLGSPILAFSTILGTLLIFSGLGSLWSGRIGHVGVYSTLGAILALLILHRWWIPSRFPIAVSLPLYLKVILAVVSLAPLAFFMGVPFPFVLRTGKVQFTESAVAMLFAINAATSALAVPLSMNISTSYGLNTTFHVGIIIYIAVGILLVSIDKRKLQLLANGFAILTVSLLMLSPWTFRQLGTGEKNPPNRYSVYGISYGNSTERENKMIHGGSSSRDRPFEWLFWVIKGNGRTILVDTGFDNPVLAKERNISNYVESVKRLTRLGILPSEVTDVILTDAHWHHIGSIGRFKNARIWMQEKEYQYAKSKVSAETPENGELRWQDIKNLKSAEKEGRLELIRGEKTIVPGITMTLGGSHTPASQYVTVQTVDGPAVIAGDSIDTYQNNRRHKPSGSAVDRHANLVTIQEMHRKAASPFLILPGHDPLVMEWFPQVSEGVIHIRYKYPTVRQTFISWRNGLSDRDRARRRFLLKFVEKTLDLID